MIGERLSITHPQLEKLMLVNCMYFHDRFSKSIIKSFFMVPPKKEIVHCTFTEYETNNVAEFRALAVVHRRPCETRFQEQRFLCKNLMYNNHCMGTCMA